VSQTHIGRFLFVSGSGLWAPDMRDDSDANAEIFNTRFCLLMTLSVRPGGISGEIKTIDSQDGVLQAMGACQMLSCFNWFPGDAKCEWQKKRCHPEIGWHLKENLKPAISHYYFMKSIRLVAVNAADSMR